MKVSNLLILGGAGVVIYFILILNNISLKCFMMK
jgi:hypothetical protein